MRILYIADGRSPIAIHWMSHFIQAGHEVHLVSTYPCELLPGVTSQQVIPLALSNYYGASAGKENLGFLRRLLPANVRTMLKQLAVPYSIPRAARTLDNIIEQVRPDLIHAMRIPYEGMIAAQALKQSASRKDHPRKPALLISVWGNDFTLHARSTRMMASYTRQTLQRCDALHTDCQRDQRLAVGLGFEDAKPKIVLPGGGGVLLELFYPADEELHDYEALTIINPRGFRAYVRNDTFFAAIPAVIERYPEARFLCPGMSDEVQAIRWAAEYCVTEKVELLSLQSRKQMAKLFRQAQISLSITTHDGTPNTLLEAMACGCFPIAGDLDSIREWITPGVNGMLVDAGDANGLSRALLEAIARPELRKQAKLINLETIKERADYNKCMHAAENFYWELIESHKGV